MQETDEDEVAALPLFSGLDETLRQRLIADAEFQRLPAGAMLFQQGDRADVIHLLISGAVEITRTNGRHECGVMMFASGDIFMPAAALFDEPYLTSGRVLTAARLLVLRGDTVRDEAMRSPALAMRLCQLVAGQWRMAVRHILDLKCRSAPERLGALLLRLVDDTPSSLTAELPFPKRNLAARIGMSAETLSRSVQLLAENGLHLRGNRIIVKDRASAERFCGPDPYPDRTETALGVHAL